MINKNLFVIEQQTAKRAALIQGINHVWTMSEQATNSERYRAFCPVKRRHCWHDFTRADLEALTPHLSADEVTALFNDAKSSDWRKYGTYTRFAIPAPHYADMYLIGLLNRYQTSGGENGRDFSESYLDVSSAMFRGKAFEPDGEVAKVYESIPHIDKAIAYAKANWPAFLEQGQGLGRSYIQVYLIDPEKAQKELSAEMVLHATLNKEWHHVACTRRIPLSRAIVNATTFLSSDRLVGLQLAAGSKPDVMLAICARCGHGIIGGNCAQCRRQIAMSDCTADSWLYWCNPPLPEQYETYAIEQGHKFTRAYSLDWARKREESQHADCEKQRRTAAYLRHVPTEGLPDTV